MAQGPTYRTKFRRRREGKTNYYRRRRLLQSRRTRLVVRKSNTKYTVQFVNALVNGDETVASAVSTQLRGLGWEFGTGNQCAAYLTGLLAGRRAIARGVTNAVLDIGRNLPVKGSGVYAALKGVVDAGVDVPHSEEVFPDESRIRGEHIVRAIEYYSANDPKGTMFSTFDKKSAKNIPKQFESTKKKIANLSDEELLRKIPTGAVSLRTERKAETRPAGEKPKIVVTRAVPRKPKPKRLVSKSKRTKKKSSRSEEQ
ncbi:MAG: 50S ribosomal protein L18 [Candidatus Thorarchaeota archaeon]